MVQLVMLTCLFLQHERESWGTRTVKPRSTKAARKKKEWAIEPHLGETKGSEVLSISVLRLCHCSARTIRLMGSVTEKTRSCFSAWWGSPSSGREGPVSWPLALTCVSIFHQGCCWQESEVRADLSPLLLSSRMNALAWLWSHAPSCMTLVLLTLWVVGWTPQGQQRPDAFLQSLCD